MPIMAVREFKCSLCQQQFTLLSGDLILPGPYFCDNCLQAVWELENEALIKHVTNCLAPRNEDQLFVHNIVQHIEGFKENWKTVDDLIRLREQQRGFFS
ncbi:MAG: hypothetical protein DWQ04_07675 [Chloroflexi bacterium]|nr:MAG: hypothetical protein DWQ04_07675 [Chloroflexota bacterium]